SHTGFSNTSPWRPGADPRLALGQPCPAPRAWPVPAVALVQPRFHLPAVAARRRLAGRPADGRRHERADAAALPRVAVIRLGVVAGIGDDAPRPDRLERRVQQRHEAVGVDARPAAGQDADDHVAGAVDAQLQLGVAAVSDGLPRAPPAGAAAGALAGWGAR